MIAFLGTICCMLVGSSMGYNNLITNSNRLYFSQLEAVSKLSRYLVLSSAFLVTKIKSSI